MTFSFGRIINPTLAADGGGGGIITDGLVARWTFEEGTGTSTSDVSGNGHNGTLITTAGWSASTPDGSAYSLDKQNPGSGGYVQVPHHTDLNGGAAITVCCWVYIQEASGGNQGLVSKSNVTADGWLLYVNGTSGSRGANWAANISGFKVKADAGSYSLNTWTHFAGTFNGSELRLFIDGVDKGATAASGTIASSTKNLSIGTLYDTGSQDLGGLIDDCRVYNRALSAAEIASIAALTG